MRTSLTSRQNLAALSLIALAATSTSAQAQTIAITGGTIHTASGPRIENGTVLIRDGKIVAVGASVTVPEGATRIDARGKWVTPGFINSATTLGLSEAGNPAFSGGYNDVSARGTNGVAASFEVWKGINPVNTYIAPARQEGVTSVVVAPGGGSMVGGKAGLLDLIEATTVGPMVRRAPVAMVGQFANPGSGNTNARPEFWAKWRELFDDVKSYQARRAAFETGDTRSYAATKADLEALIPVVRGEMPLILNVDRASDIVEAIAFAREQRIRLWIAGGSEGWMVAPQIAAAGVPVFTGAMNNIPGDFNTLGQRQENAALLKAAGVTVVLIGNGPGDPASFNVRNIRQEAGNAVAYGMSWDDALRAITAVPAQVLGVEAQVGTLQAGRDANLTIWSGDPFEFSSVAEHVYIKGQEFLTRSRQQMLTDRYKTLPPSYQRP